jgi:hypothetical protein
MEKIILSLILRIRVIKVWKKQCGNSFRGCNGKGIFNRCDTQAGVNS